MADIQRVIVFTAFVAAVGIGAFAARQNSKLGEQIQTLQQQQTLLSEQVKELKQEQAALKHRVTPPRSTSAVAQPDPAIVPFRQLSTETNLPSPDLEAELERALSEPSPGKREAAIKKLSQSISSVDFPRALAFLAQKPGMDGVQSPLFADLASKWGAKDQSAALAWANSLTETNALKSALVNVVSGWASTSREDAARYAVAMPPGEIQDATILKVLGDWSFRDAAGVTDWITQLPEGKVRDEAVGTVVFWGTGQCPAAIAEMLDNIGSNDLLQKHGEMVASVWLSRDQAAARAWIEKSSLPDEVKQRLLSRQK